MTSGRFIGIVCGLKSEAAAMRAAARSDKIRIAVSGASAERAEAMAHQFSRDGAKAIVSIGVSGGLDPMLRPGDLIVGETVRTRRGEEFAAAGPLLAALALDEEAPLRRAALFGADQIVATALAKARIYEQFGAAAVDMESHGAARAARSAGIPFAAIRAIADPASRALPAAALDAVAPDGSTKIFTVLAACVKAPGEFPALLKLGADSEAALKTLRRDLGGLFRRLLFSLDL